MGLVAGASQFLSSATLTNLTGQSARAPSLLGDASISLLDSGRRINRSGIGLSANSRQLIRTFVDQTSGLGNVLLSATAEANSVENLQTRILAIRSSLPDSAISPTVLGETEETVSADSNVGTNVDTTA